ncbi:MAG: DUF6452 family protein [Bacteroidales bacterium]|nr:DUF6452 family protein [Bacteroidales bacterium]
MKKCIFIVATLFAVIVVACSETSDMLLSYQNTLQVGVYSRHTKNDTTLVNFVAYGEGRSDSLLYNMETVGEIFLNLNMHADSVRFILQTQSLQDEMFVRYSKSLEPVSASGGITMNLHVDSISTTHVFIDSVAVSHPAVKYNESLENVKIFVY